MSNFLLNQAWSVTVSSPTAKLVLVRLADRADAEGVCWPTQATLQAETQLSESTVRRALAELIRDGHVSVVHRSRRPGVGKGAALYRVHPELLNAPTPVTVTGVNWSTPVTLTGVECPTPVTVTGQTLPTPVSLTGVANPTPVTVTADTGHCDRSSRENPQEPTSTTLPSSGRNGHEVVVEESRGRVVGDLAAIEAVWALWPKRVSELAAKLEIGHALRRDGAQVLSGTAAIVAADRLRNPTVTPPGRYLPEPVRFFADSRYLDDPAQYGPRQAGQDSAVDPGEARRRLSELRTLLAEHPGNPDNAVGSFARKAKARPAWEALREEHEKLRRQLFASDDSHE